MTSTLLWPTNLIPRHQVSQRRGLSLCWFVTSKDSGSQVPLHHICACLRVTGSSSVDHFFRSEIGLHPRQSSSKECNSANKASKSCCCKCLVQETVLVLQAKLTAHLASPIHLTHPSRAYLGNTAYDEPNSIQLMWATPYPFYSIQHF